MKSQFVAYRHDRLHILRPQYPSEVISVETFVPATAIIDPYRVGRERLQKDVSIPVKEYTEALTIVALVDGAHIYIAFRVTSKQEAALYFLRWPVKAELYVMITWGHILVAFFVSYGPCVMVSVFIQRIFPCVYAGEVCYSTISPIAVCWQRQNEPWVIVVHHHLVAEGKGSISTIYNAEVGRIVFCEVVKFSSYVPGQAEMLVKAEKPLLFKP